MKYLRGLLLTATRSVAALSAATLALGACGGGSSDEGARLDPSAERALGGPSAQAAADKEPPRDAAAMGNMVAEGVVEAEAQASAEAAPPVAPHPTRLVMLDDGLYARDADNNWSKYENGSWVSVHAPQLPAGTQ